ncbi:hypothetical protein BJV77DRAFT_1109915 [Russula vinacea]|nr:hypothetical protein BJV77DRAFT_1109915 [Russula vinacea]
MPPSRPRKIFAQAPFDDAQADVILQSSDQVHFQVFKNILSLASPIFADTFSFPSPPSKPPMTKYRWLLYLRTRQLLKLLYVIFIRCKPRPPRRRSYAMRASSLSLRENIKWNR